MKEPPFWNLMTHIVPSVIGTILCLVILMALIKKPSRTMFLFFCFYLISVAHLAAAFITPVITRNTGVYGIGRFWSVALVISRLRYLFLLLFTHSVWKFRFTTALTVIMTGIVTLGIISPFLFYSIIPSLMEIAVVLYSFSYWLTVFLLRNRLGMSRRRQGMIRAVLVCSGFFLTGVILDIVEGIPQASVYVSILLVDFYPAYLVSIGAVMAFWAVRDLTQPEAPGVSEAAGLPGVDLSALPVTGREREIIGLILTGKTNGEIAEQLFISESTVKKHINNLFRKLGIASRWELLRLRENSRPAD